MPVANWSPLATDALRAAGFQSVFLSGRLFAWKQIENLRSLRYADGFNVFRVDLAPKRSALAVLPQRHYFEADGDAIDWRPEHEIVATTRPPQPAPHARVTGALQLALELAERLPHGKCALADADDLAPNLFDTAVIRIRENDVAIRGSSLMKVYRAMGFDSAPIDFVVTVVPVGGASVGVARRFGDWVKSAGGRTGVSVRIRVSDLEAVEAASSELKSARRPSAPGRCLLFLLPDKATVVPPEARRLMDELEALGVPFRRAYSDDPHDISVPHQFSSLLSAAGGRPHRAELLHEGVPLWTVGLDLSHPKGGNGSTLAATLVDPAGNLVHAWTTPQERDETARSDSVRRVLEPCAEMLGELDQDPLVLVMRDGRHFARESVGLYSTILGGRISTIECAKGWNPLILHDDDSAVRIPRAVQMNGSNTLFLVPAEPKTAQDMPTVLKIRWHDSWNAVGLTADEIARALVRSTLGPGLGASLRQAPAPIYWADGIASGGRDGLAFMGQPVSRV